MDTRDRSYSKLEKAKFYTSLLCLVKSLERRYVVIDLRNETSVTGKLVEVDGFMNVTLDDAAFYYEDDHYMYFEKFFILSKNIRNVHIPTNVNMIKSIKEQVTPIPKQKEKKQSTFKDRQRRRKQEATLKLIEESRQQQ